MAYKGLKLNKMSPINYRKKLCGDREASVFGTQVANLMEVFIFVRRSCLLLFTPLPQKCSMTRRGTCFSQQLTLSKWPLRARGMTLLCVHDLFANCKQNLHSALCERCRYIMLRARAR